MFKRTCLICGKEFETKYHAQVYCQSEECQKERKRRNDKKQYEKEKAKNREEIGLLKCEICGKEFYPYNRLQKSCSEECRAQLKARKSKRYKVKNPDKIREYNHAKYQKRKAANLCVTCRKPLTAEDAGHAHCAKCRESLRENSRLNREFWKKLGLCSRCGKNAVYGTDRMCFECRAKEANRYSEGKIRKTYQEQREARLKRYRQRKSEGLCVLCGNPIDDKKHTFCQKCRLKRREKDRVRRGYYIREDRKERYKSGLCYRCDNPIVPGYRLCEKHLAINREITRKLNNSEHIWRKHPLILGRGKYE